MEYTRRFSYRQSHEEYSYSSISGKLAAIFLFYDMNDTVLNKKKICRYMGEHEKTTCQDQGIQRH